MKDSEDRHVRWEYIEEKHWMESPGGGYVCLIMRWPQLRLSFRDWMEHRDMTKRNEEQLQSTEDQR